MARIEQRKPRKPKLYLKRRPMRPCFYCENKDKDIDFKDIETMLRFQNDRGKIASLKQSCLCAKHQRAIAIAIKRAREIGLVPYTA